MRKTVVRLQSSASLFVTREKVFEPVSKLRFGQMFDVMGDLDVVSDGSCLLQNDSFFPLKLSSVDPYEYSYSFLKTAVQLHARYIKFYFCFTSFDNASQVRVQLIELFPSSSAK